VARSNFRAVAVVAGVVVAAVASTLIVRAVGNDDEPERIVIKITSPANHHGAQITDQGLHTRRGARITGHDPRNR
jgi:hypothetical protein